MELNKRIEDELDKQFPKGDNARGRALMLHSIAQIELEELQQAYDIAMQEIAKMRRLLGYGLSNDKEVKHDK